MERTAATPRSSQGSLRIRGAVSGYLFKLVRESLGLTQVQLAERLRIDVTIVQSWESGRRPLTALRAGDLFKFRMSLVRLGASPKIFSVLSDVIEADLLITDAVAMGAVTEYEAQTSQEARCAKDADKLECLVQAIEYQAAGYRGVQGWIDSSYAALRTDTARRIADAALTTSPLAWRDR
jgi:transcriptional regulator with XRE-family HTH domain